MATHLLELSEDAVGTLAETVTRRKVELEVELRGDLPARLRQSIADQIRELDEVLDEIERVTV